MENLQKEITKMFSSASCLNGSFLDKSCDKHFQTSPKQSDLDLSHRKLAKKDKVLRLKLLSSTHCFPPCMRSPLEWRAWCLVLPELLRVLHKQHRWTDLTEPLFYAAATLCSSYMHSHFNHTYMYCTCYLNNPD
ncbi:unnamed protein product [Oncorhynchus mykiss]|uniref:Uncharacterized protein n=1 Tax=Oncorhynchus mykiss TaxID=8022 RepID=A0A060XTS5_ONCMY|nr:unnamed protein product [Oncorhynchus mykiss]